MQLLPALLTLFAAAAYPASAQSEISAAPAAPARVLMIGIDGLRPDSLLASKTPNLDRLAAQGILTLKARTTPVTSSGPAWTSILTGAPMALHGVRDNSFHHRNKAWPTWLEQLETQRPGATTAAIVQWQPIHQELTRNSVDYSACVTTAAAVSEGARQLLLDPFQDLTALFLHYDDVDKAGHAFGYSPKIPQYLAAVEAIDSEIAKVLHALKARKDFAKERWLILVGTDHGGQGKEHGSNIPSCRTVFMLASGTGAEGLAWREHPEVEDFSALALRHLGLHGPAIPEPRTETWWTERQQLLNQRAAQGQRAQVLFLGDSITHGWESGGAKIWQKYYAPLDAINLGIGGDRTEHVLWRLRHGNLKNLAPAVTVLMIGTNNTPYHTPKAIAKGVQAIVIELLTQLPQTEVLLLATFPRGADAHDALRQVNAASNALLQTWSTNIPRLHYLDINSKFLQPDGTLSTAIMPDLLHPNATGYQIWADAIAPLLQKLRNGKTVR